MDEEAMRTAWDEIRKMVVDGRPYDEINEAISARMPPGPLKADDPIDRTLAGLPMDPGDPALSDQAGMGWAPSDSMNTGPEPPVDPDFLALKPEDGEGKTTLSVKVDVA